MVLAGISGPRAHPRATGLVRIVAVGFGGTPARGPGSPAPKALSPSPIGTHDVSNPANRRHLHETQACPDTAGGVPAIGRRPDARGVIRPLARATHPLRCRSHTRHRTL